jgi:uncharacterized protein (TIGR02118 family)
MPAGHARSPAPNALGGYHMVMISILYPNKNGSKFDSEYYINTHMPMSIERLSKHAGFRGVSVIRGVGGEMPGSEPAFVALCQYQFDSPDDFWQRLIPMRRSFKAIW